MRRDSASGRRLGVLLAALLCTAAPAAAATPPPPPPPAPDDAAIYQYRESLPASGGPVVPDGAAGGGQPLPQALAQQLERTGGSDAALLERVATSPALGAPVARRQATPVPASAEPVSGDEPSAGDSLGAAAGALDGDARLLVLLAAMLAITAAAVVAGIRRRPATDSR